MIPRFVVVVVLAAAVLSLVACATAHTPGPSGLPANLPPWGAALLAKVGAMEGEITTMKATIASQSDSGNVPNSW